MKTYKALIFDCDGVLIDSEVLACTVTADWFRRHGYEIGVDDYIERFMGKHTNQALEEIRVETGRDFSNLPDREETKARLTAVFEADLKPCHGIAGLLAKTSLPIAVASGSGIERLHHSLSITGLLQYFNGHIYSSELVARGKPAPDIFLYVAAKLGVAPADCLIIEDGIYGLQAATAAGMDAICYTGGSHMTERLKEKLRAESPLLMFDDMQNFPVLNLDA